ncbi:MAG: CoA transferase [Chloroflexi bacterium]|nr:CoA transferase [Chloroflexota bacterium]
MLSPFRVLDLTDEKGLLCGKILGDLGADLIKIERPGGDTSRQIGPFWHDMPHPEKSLFWFAFNANKRGITLDIGKDDGKEIFKTLVRTSDVVIESAPPGYMDSLGLGYSTLTELNPGVIMTSVTPFGQTGPYAGYEASDLVLMAMGSLMYLSGDPDRPPVRISLPQAFLNASADAAVGTMLALYHREISGEGQHVDVSVQESVLFIPMNAHLFWDLNKKMLRRSGSYRTGLSTDAVQQLVWPCKDGYITFALMGGAYGAPSNRALVEWMATEGKCPEYLKQKEWDRFDMALVTQAELDTVARPLGEFFLGHTRAELFEGAQERKIIFYPVNTIKDIVEDPQLAARNFWMDVEHPELAATITYPGPFSTVDSSKAWRRAPLIGEHNEEIYVNEMGYSKQRVVILKQAGII